MAANKRIFYAVEEVGFSQIGKNTFTAVHGVQSVGINTKFNLEQIFELGQVSIYDNLENLPDVEITMEKVLDGYPLIYHHATRGATSPTLAGRSNIQATVGLSIFSDTQDAASGTPVAQCTISGVFVSQLSYAAQVDGNATESVTMVGNDKTWSTGVFTFTGAFANNDSPLSGDVQRRQDILFGPTDTTVLSACLLPLDLPGLTASGTNEQDTAGNYGAHIQSVKTSTNLGRNPLWELGRRGYYHRYVNFPVEVTTDFEVISIIGDLKNCSTTALNNVTNQRIVLLWRDGTKIDLGTKNKLNSVTHSGGNAAQNGGNVTNTFSFTTFNDFTCTHPQDPSGL